MATPVTEVYINGLRITHFEQLLAYIEERNRPDNQWYYGNRKYFEKQHKELENWVKMIICKYEASN